MRIATVTQLRRDLAAVLDRVAADREPVIVTRNRGKPAAVLIPIEDLSSCHETSYLLASPANAERLFASIAELDADRGTELDRFRSSQPVCR